MTTTLDAETAVRHPKLSEQNTFNMLQHDAEVKSSPKSFDEHKKRLDSAKSYTDIVNTDHSGQTLPVANRSSDPISPSPVEHDGPITSTIISNMKGRSIIGGSKDFVVELNGSRQEFTKQESLGVGFNSGTDQSTHRISNDKLATIAAHPYSGGPFTPN